jgi:phage terminase small subunit
MSSSGRNRTDKIKLTPKQQAFCDYYLQSGNATESAIKAGYSKKTARSVGAENLTKPYIIDYIKERQYKIHSSNIATEVEIKEFWTYAMISAGNELKDRIKASELLAKTKGMFLDKQEIKITSSTILEELKKMTPEQIQELLNEL